MADRNRPAEHSLQVLYARIGLRARPEESRLRIWEEDARVIEEDCACEHDADDGDLGEQREPLDGGRFLDGFALSLEQLIEPVEEPPRANVS